MDQDPQMLVLRAQRGEVEAFSLLVQHHWARLVSFARSVVGSNDAEDAVQDAFVAAWQKIRGLQAPEAFPSWILRIVSRKCISRVRRSWRMTLVADIGDSPDPAGRRGIESIDVERVLRVLPARQRAVMHLTVVEEMSDSEIGEALHITPASVRSHRRRARTSLNRVLRATWPSGGREQHETG